MERRSFLARLLAGLGGGVLLGRLTAPAQEAGNGKINNGPQAGTPPADVDAALKKKLGGPRATIYPFDVRIGGQTAVVEGDPKVATFAKIANPVASDAELEVDGAPAMLIVNVFPVRPSGEVPTGAPVKAIFVQSGTRVRLDATVDKSILPPGLYGANVVWSGTTSRVMFTVR